MSREPIYQPQTNTWRVLLTRGYEAIIDAVDVGLADVMWFAMPNSNTVYASRNEPLGNGKQTTVMLHRAILAAKLGRDLRVDEHVDHIDGNGLNNTRANLRLATKAQNAANRGKQSNNTSGFKGVYWNKHAGKWSAQIQVNGTSKHLGYYISKEAAYAAYCEAAEEYFGEFANSG